MDDVLISEHEIGTCGMVEELEAAFLHSCEHNNTTPEDLKYFRSYLWNLIAMITLKMNDH